MTKPITMDIPHELGIAEARRRLEGGAAQIAGMVPGSTVKSHRWSGNVLLFELEALGQQVKTKLEVFEDRIHAEVDLPPMIALFADKVRGRLQGLGTNLLC